MSEQWAMRSVKCEVWKVECEVWSVKCEVWSVKCEVWVNRAPLSLVHAPSSPAYVLLFVLGSTQLNFTDFAEKTQTTKKIDKRPAAHVLSMQ